MANSEAWKRLNAIASSWVKESGSPLVVGSGDRSMESVDLGLGSGGLGEVTRKRCVMLGEENVAVLGSQDSLPKKNKGKEPMEGKEMGEMGAIQEHRLGISELLTDLEGNKGVRAGAVEGLGQEVDMEGLNEIGRAHV